jgi:pyochelin synthetase
VIVADLLHRLAHADITLSVEGGGLRYRGPKGSLTPELRTAIAANKSELLEWLTTNASAERLEFPRDPIHRHEPFPLTDLQQAYLVGERDFYSNPTVAHLYQRYVVQDLSIDRIRYAVRAVVQLHDVLRLVVLPDGKQVVQPTVAYDPAYEDLRSLQPDTALARVEQRGQAFAAELAAVERGPMWSVAIQQLENRCYLHFAVRLFAFDAVTLHSIYRDLVGLYNNPDYAAPHGELSFRDYVLGLDRYQRTTRYQRSLEYWKARAHTLPACPELPLTTSNSTMQPSRLQRLSGRLSRESWQGFRDLARYHQRPVNSVLCTIYADTLARWAPVPFTLNVLSANRPQNDPHTLTVVGNCSTTTLLQVPAIDATFAERVVQLQRQLYSDLDHNAVSGIQVIRELAREAPGGEPLMPIVFSSGIALTGGSSSFELLIPSPEFQLVDSWLATPQVWLDHQVMEEGGELVFNWDYASDRFPRGVPEEMFEYYSPTDTSRLDGVLTRRNSNSRAARSTSSSSRRSEGHQMLPRCSRTTSA